MYVYRYIDSLFYWYFLIYFDTDIASTRKTAVPQLPHVAVLGGPFDLVSRVSKVGYGGL